MENQSLDNDSDICEKKMSYKQKLKYNKNLLDDAYSVEELRDIKNHPLDKVRFHSKGVGGRKSSRVFDEEGYVICKICSGRYRPKNSTHHNKTKQHQIFLKLNEKMRDLILS